jgi:hypothetical protein
VRDIEIIRRGQRGTSLEKGGQFEIAFVFLNRRLSELKNRVGVNSFGLGHALVSYGAVGCKIRSGLTLTLDSGENNGSVSRAEGFLAQVDYDIMVGSPIRGGESNSR